jgi:hypothetical protein
MESPEGTPQEGELEESQEGFDEDDESAGSETGVENPAEGGDPAPTG